MKTWIVVVNRSEAKIFENNGRGHQGDLKFVEKLENPKGRLKAIDINADKPGFVPSIGNHGGSLVKPQSPTDRVAQMFAKKVATHLEESCRQNIFDELVLIAAPQFLGKMRALFSRELKECVAREIAKDLGPTVTASDLKERLWPVPEVRIEL